MQCTESRGLYIHIPFCKFRCHYCAFYSSTEYDGDLQAAYVDQLLKEIDARAVGKDFDTIFVGGGTPTVLELPLMEKLFQELTQFKAKEFTVEANPESLARRTLSLFKSYGINRVSIGVQSFQDDALKVLGRIHSAREAVRAARLVKEEELKLSLDIMVDLPGMSDSYSGLYDAQQAVELAPDHISSYSYMDETSYMQETNQTIYPELVEYLESKGYERYEISNFSNSGEYCFHNIGYWHMKEYIGIGASSHSMWHEGGRRFRGTNPPSVDGYIAQKTFPNATDELTDQDVRLENVAFPLRTKFGLERYVLDEVMTSNLQKYLHKMIDEGLLVATPNRYYATHKGMLYLDHMVENIISYLE